MILIDENIEIDAERLILRPVSPKFREDIFREFTARVTKYMPFTPNGDISITDEFIKNSGRELYAKTNVELCILLKSNNEEFLGCCGLHHTNTRAIEIGLWLKESVHGKGYGAETVQALMDWADRYLDFDYLYYPVDKENLANRRIPEKLKFIKTKGYIKKKKRHRKPSYH